MAPGAPDASRWLRTEPRRILPADVLERVAKAAFPHSRLLEVQPLTAGLRNANFILRLDSAPDLVVLRIYDHEESLCQKEVDLMHLIGGSVPVPEVTHAEPRGLDDLQPFILTRYVDGINFGDLKPNGDSEAITQAAYSAGEVLAAIGRTRFKKSGWLGPGPEVTAPLLEGADPVPRFVDLCLAAPSLQR